MTGAQVHCYAPRERVSGGDLEKNSLPSARACLPASPALCQDLPPLPPSAPNAEPPPSEPRSSSISPAPAPRLQARRPERARDPRDPCPARGSEPGDACPGLRSIPFARPSRAGHAAPSSLFGSAVQRPRLPARCPRRSRPCTPRRLPRTRRCADSFPLLAGARLQHRAPSLQPAADPHLTHFP